MKTKTLILLALIAGALYSCIPGTKPNVPKVSVSMPTTNVITKVTQITTKISGDGFFATFLYDTVSDYLLFRTVQDSFIVPNDRTVNFITGRYDPETKDLIWVNLGGGAGTDVGCQYFAYCDSRPGREKALYVVGYYEDSAYFLLNARNKSKSAGIGPCKGGTDMFFARYDAENGTLNWITTLGTTGKDIGFVYKEPSGTPRLSDGVVLMVIDTAKPTIDIYAHFGDSIHFSDSDIVPQGRYVKLRYDRANGTTGPISVTLPDNVPDDH